MAAPFGAASGLAGAAGPFSSGFFSSVFFSASVVVASVFGVSAAFSCGFARNIVSLFFS